MGSTISPHALEILQEREPGATFTASGPKVTSSNGKTYFVKSDRVTPTLHDQYKGEMDSLIAIYKAAPGLCPQPLVLRIDQPHITMISEYADKTALNENSAKILAGRMAKELHEPKNSEEEAKGRFGFGCATYCGATRLENGWSDTWDEAFGKLLKTLVDGLKKKGHSYREVYELGDKVISQVVPHLLDPSRLKVEPVILHGDLWSGNVGTLSSGQPVIFDPASYYGHNEADLAIVRIFGGFGSSFFSEYHRDGNRPEAEPKDESGERVALYELFHYLNHTLLFGHSYASPSIDRMKHLIAWAERSARA